jgi:hypothetical protein
MVVSTGSLVGVALGIGLAAAAGFRVFLPLLVAAVAARWGGLPLAEGFDWLASSGAIAALATATLLEVAAYFFPGVDHALDVVAAPASLIAGTIVSASAMVNIPPTILWPVAIIAGGGVAGLVKGTAALVRAKTGLATLGLSNPLVSAVETASATLLAVMAVLLPVLSLLAIILLLAWIGRRVRRAVLRSAY